jgi:hypothetical protein
MVFNKETIKVIHGSVYTFVLKYESLLYLLTSTFFFFYGFYILCFCMCVYAVFIFLCTRFTALSEFRSTMKSDRAAREHHLKHEFYFSSLLNMTLNVLMAFFRISISLFGDSSVFESVFFDVNLGSSDIPFPLFMGRLLYLAFTLSHLYMMYVGYVIIFHRNVATKYQTIKMLETVVMGGGTVAISLGGYLMSHHGDDPIQAGLLKGLGLYSVGSAEESKVVNKLTNIGVPRQTLGLLVNKEGIIPVEIVDRSNLMLEAAKIIYPYDSEKHAEYVVTDIHNILSAKHKGVNLGEVYKPDPNLPIMSRVFLHRIPTTDAQKIANIVANDVLLKKKP